MKKRYITPKAYIVIVDDTMLLSGSVYIGITSKPGDKKEEVLSRSGVFEDFDDDEEE